MMSHFVWIVITIMCDGGYGACDAAPTSAAVFSSQEQCDRVMIELRDHYDSKGRYIAGPLMACLKTAVDINR